MIYCTGDTHGSRYKFLNHVFPLQKKLTKNDYIIILGDFGMIWDNTESKEEKFVLDEFNNRKFTTLFVDGNHENHVALNNNYPAIDFHGGRAHKIRDSVFHLMRGEIFEIDGISLFAMGGAESTDKFCRKEGLDWWREEVPSMAEFENGFRNLEKRGNKVDYILTHCGPDELVDILGRGAYKHNIVSNYLQAIYKTVDFKKWYLGHYHCDKTFAKFTVLYEEIIKLGDDIIE